MIKKVKPTSPARRAQTYLIRNTSKGKLDKGVSKKLTIDIKGASGRSHGRQTVFHRHNGADKRYRIIDFKRDKKDIPAKVSEIRYDPNRSCDIALVFYADGEKRFILAPNGLKIGDTVLSGEKTESKAGNAMPLREIPIGTAMHNIELYPGAGGKFVRSAGQAAFVTAKEKDFVNVRMPSGEVRRFSADCYATIGQLTNEDFKLVSIGKAGRSFHLGKRGKSRGKARSYGHPLSGSYKRRVGRQPVDKWGNLSKGKKTRVRKHTNRYLVSDRRKK